MKLTPENCFWISKAITDKHKNVVIGEGSSHCIHLAVTQDTTYDWHHHPNSDELFIGLEGELTLEFLGETHDYGYKNRGEHIYV